MLRQGGHGFLDSPTVYERWSDHLAEKVWFDPDDFAAMLKRFEIASERASR
jgi:hypothetical protein